MDDLLATGRLKLSPAGAHLTSTDTDHGELFYVSSTTKHGAGNAIRGGVPVIAPWFADLLDLTPRHGWARTSPWRVTVDKVGLEASMVEGGIALRLTVAELSDGVRLELTVSNESDTAKTVQLAFHPYFAVPDVEKIAVRGLEGVTLVDRVSNETSKVEGDITFNGLVDGIALDTPDVQIISEERIITVRSFGGDSTVVWNPGQKKADSMEDIGVLEWNDFVCVEPALLGADQDGVQLTPGEINVLEMDVTVEAR